MTYDRLYRQVISMLKEAGNENPAFDTLCLFETFLHMNRHNIIMNGEKEVGSEEKNHILNLAQKRATGYPLQYLCGKWEFMGNEFFVGEGVLIPREDTACVVELCLENIARHQLKSPKIIDLCAGSGAIAIALAKQIPNSTVTAVELSEQALYYLRKNIAHNGCQNVTAVMGDVLQENIPYPSESFDVIISNPPYISTEEIRTLQKEVQYEPFMALNGGEDGCIFYRKIITEWKTVLRHNGLLVFELGENQSETVANLMQENGFAETEYVYDIQHIKRGICGIKYS